MFVLAWAGIYSGSHESEDAFLPLVGEIRAMQIFLQTDRLVLRRFTVGEVDNLVDLDSDPEVMRFLTGGKATPREAIENETLPRFLDYYERFPGYGFWAAMERSTGEFVGWFHFRPLEEAAPTKPSLDTGYGDQPGARATRPKERAP